MAAPGSSDRFDLAVRRFLDASQGTGAIFVVNADGSGARQLTHPPANRVDERPDWAPDGSRIVYVREHGFGEAAPEFWTVKPDGSDPRLIAPACSDGAPPRCLQTAPVYSPDGKQIAYNWSSGRARPSGRVDVDGVVQLSEVYLMNADGSNPHPLTSMSTHAPYSEPFAGDADSPNWAPDGKRLVFLHSSSANGKPLSTTALFVINADGSGLRRLTPSNLSAGSRPDWSSDGSQIVFHTVPKNREAPGGNIYTIHPDGTHLRQLTNFKPTSTLGELAFSWDGARIAFTRGGNNRDLFVMRADGTDIKQITHPTSTGQSDNWPSWGPPAR